MRYLLQGILPTNPVQKEKLKKYVTRFKVVDGKLLKRSFQERWMVCIPAKEVNGVLSNPHQGEPARHPGGRKLWQMALHEEYYWPTMQRDAQDIARKCQACQRQEDEIHSSHQSLHPTVAPYPFHSLRVGFYRTYKPPSEGCIWILVATELFTKWVEAVALKKATSSSVANFLWKNIICCFGVPNKIISNNSTPFLNKDVCRLTNWYFISHTASAPYYPKGNGQVQAFNKRQLKILRKMTKENGKGWKEELLIALWAHITAKSQATRAAPFSLVYGTKAIIPIDLVRPAVKLAEIARIPREDTLEIMEEMRNNAAFHNCPYLANMKARHKGQVKERKF